MIITAEISLYPLVEEYESVIINFIKALKVEKTLKVTTHAMSTYVIGENNIVFKAISNALELSNSEVETLSLVIKLINRDLPIDQNLEF